MFGISRRETIGLRLDLIVPEPIRGAHAAGMMRLAKGGAALGPDDALKLPVSLRTLNLA